MQSKNISRAALTQYSICMIVAKKFEELHGQKGGKKDKTPQKPQQQQEKKQEKKKPEPKKPEAPPAKPVNLYHMIFDITL